MKRTLYSILIKRFLDFTVSLLALILLSPLLFIIFLFVKFKLGSPVIFKQERPGLNEQIFNLYKFRSMTNLKDCNGQLLPDELRLTKFGKFLRSTSLDELPSLINIVKGDMSIVGPRPLLVKYLPLYNENQRKRHMVRPGLTGLAQIHGRNNLDWQTKFSHDLKYIYNQSFLLDIYIILKTIIVVFQRKNTYSTLTNSSYEFKGNNEDFNCI